MPEPPATDFFTRFVLENPWPAGLVLLAIAAVLGWLGLREGLKNRVCVAFALAIVGAGVIATGLLVITAGEHGRRVTRALVDAVVSEDVVASMALFSDDAVMNSGSPNNPGLGIDTISRRLSNLADRFDIESNTITELTGYSVLGDEAEVRLACRTTVTSFPNISQWILRVRKASDGQWKITRLTCVSINDQTLDIDQILGR